MSCAYLCLVKHWLELYKVVFYNGDGICMNMLQFFLQMIHFFQVAPNHFKKNPLIIYVYIYILYIYTFLYYYEFMTIQ